MRNLEGSFQSIRAVCFAVVVGAFALCGYVFFSATRAVSHAGDRIYILAGNKVLEAMAGDRKENIPVEARDHIRNFHVLFFTLDPDEKVITDNLGRALYLAVPKQARACSHDELEALVPHGFAGPVIRSTVEELFPRPDTCTARYYV